ncbi:hypothetical protein ACSBR2_030183 [Camellia fascicularis]
MVSEVVESGVVGNRGDRRDEGEEDEWAALKNKARWRKNGAASDSIHSSLNLKLQLLVTDWAFVILPRSRLHDYAFQIFGIFFYFILWEKEMWQQIVIDTVQNQSMASFTSIATSTTWPRQLCACGYGQCVVKISKNPGRPYYACPCPVTNKACAEFRTKTLEHRDLLETVFTGAAVTGKHHWTPRKKIDEPAAISSDSVESLGLHPFADLIPTCAANVEAESSVEAGDIGEKGNGLQPQVMQSRKSRQVVCQL